MQYLNAYCQKKGIIMKKFIFFAGVAVLIIGLSASHFLAKGSKSVNRMNTPSGLQYEIIKPASGSSPKAGQTVTVHYTGWLDNNGQKGKQFDSSVSRGQPFSFTIGVGQVIKGWDEGVLTMHVGEKRLLVIPAHLGYGARGVPGVIPANATLLFEVELLKIS